MKKLVTLLLVAALMLSLAACGGGSDTPSNDTNTPQNTETPSGGETEPSGGEENETPSDTSTNEDIQLVVGETYSLDSFDITITGFDFTEKAENPEGDYHVQPTDGNVSANLYYTIKFTGKAEVPIWRCEPSTLFYSDGYVFNEVDKFWYYDESFGWTDNSSSSIQPLMPEFPCKACFFVPKEVETEKGNALSIVFLNLDSDDTEIYFSPRPEDDNLKEHIYNYCMEMDKADTWAERKFARSMMIELDDYKNCGLEARLHFFTYDDREFFKEYVADLEPMSGDAIEALLTDATFPVRSGYGGEHTITFHADGTLDATYIGLGGKEYSKYESWRMENGSVIFGGEITESSFVPYQLDETRYLLIDTEGDDSMVLTTLEG